MAKRGGGAARYRPSAWSLARPPFLVEAIYGGLRDYVCMADTVFGTECRIQHRVVARNADHSNATTPWRLAAELSASRGEQKHRQPWFTVGVRGYITESRRRSVPIRTRGMHPSSSAQSGGVLRPRILSDCLIEIVLHDRPREACSTDLPRHGAFRGRCRILYLEPRDR